MFCRNFNEISNEWVREKNSCTNPKARRRVEEIQNRIREKIENGGNSFTPDEFKEFLIFKGGARNVSKFLGKYTGTNEVEEITSTIFETDLFVREFQETGNLIRGNDILNNIMNLFDRLQSLEFVGSGVASACLSLCFPKLCVTADYIVPTLLHSKRDNLGNMNPLFRNAQTKQHIVALQIPFRNGLTPYKARRIATLGYRDYTQNIWKIKRKFELNEPVRKIEEAFWSFGICYVKKENDNSPTIFTNEPLPPKSGPFSKCCPNQYRNKGELLRLSKKSK